MIRYATPDEVFMIRYDTSDDLFSGDLRAVRCKSCRKYFVYRMSDRQVTGGTRFVTCPCGVPFTLAIGDLR